MKGDATYINHYEYQRGYRQAVLDAVDAVRAMCQDCDDIIAAIEALHSAAPHTSTVQPAATAPTFFGHWRGAP